MQATCVTHSSDVGTVAISGCDRNYTVTLNSLQSSILLMFDAPLRGNEGRSSLSTAARNEAKLSRDQILGRLSTACDPAEVYRTINVEIHHRSVA